MIKQFNQQEIDTAYNSAPALVQEALVTDPYLDFALSLQTNYKLHVDIAGAITGLMQNLLLGLINPNEFVSGLTDLNISPSLVTQITTELNTKVFKPLQEKIKGTTSTQPQAPSTSEIPTVTDEIESIVIPVPEIPVAPQITAVVAPPIQLHREFSEPQSVPIQPQTVPIRPRPTPYTAPTPQPIQSGDEHREALRKIVKEYSADPYREPTE